MSYGQDPEQIIAPSMAPSAEVYFATRLQSKEIWPIWQYLEDYDEATLFTVIEILYDHIGIYNYETDEFESELPKGSFLNKSIIFCEHMIRDITLNQQMDL